MKTIVYHIDGLDCANCALKVERKLNKNEHISEARVDFAKSKVFVKVHEDHVNDEHLRVILEKDVKSVEDATLRSVQSDKKKDKLDIQSIILAVFTVITLLSFFVESSIFDVLLIVGYGLVGYPILRKAFNNIRRNEWFDEFFLMSLATIGALILGDFAEALGVMVFYRIGEAIQEYALNNARARIRDSHDNLRSKVIKLEDNQQILVDASECQVYDHILLQAGQVIPVDGVVLEGESELNLAHISGESKPVMVKKGDLVLSGSLNMNGRLVLEVKETFSNSYEQRIQHLIDETSLKKAPLEESITRFSKRYTPIVLSLALLVLIVVGFTSGFEVGLRRSLIFLVVSCPCALLISVPLSFAAAISKSSQKGIIVKGASVLQALSEIKTVVFDKTGTLTKGEFGLKEVVSYSDIDVHQVAAHILSSSSHPVAQSILNTYQGEYDHQRVRDVQEISGQGVVAKFDGQVMFVGNRSLAQSFNVQIDPMIQGTSLTFVGMDHKLLGYIVLEDVLKEDSIALVHELKKNGYSTILISGDSKLEGDRMQAQLNLDQAYSEVKPEEKLSLIERIKENGRIIYVGDGLNDAPAMALADVSVAIFKSGNDRLVDVSDMVVLRKDASSIYHAILMAKQSIQAVYFNLAFILIIKGVVLLLASLGLTHIWLAVFADVGVAILAIFFALGFINQGKYETLRH
ncbi:MAG: cadmium-translocating P-type ATPase [Erysipelotrichaceae bacterium]|nr:cadmium-translocating P-type ATPase [Erysipelotrichaceae bacterium]